MAKSPDRKPGAHVSHKIEVAGTANMPRPTPHPEGRASRSAHADP
jgi:hypothetical protein